ncbi:MAG: hypothetical protein J0L51_11590 [Rhizobiales bacterium]|nr:hypothetical protein [Hyphomicrobiales bacterium]
MGVISELLANDKDGSLRRHIFRVTQVAGYVLVLGLVLFLAGVTWRMFTGAEVELFGIRVANPEKPEVPERLPTPASPKEMAAPAPPVGALPFSVGNASHWVPIPGDFETCMQATNDVLSRSQLTNFRREGVGFIGTVARPDLSKVDVFARCLSLNGFSVSFINVISGNQSFNMEVTNRISSEFTAKFGAFAMDRIGGTTDKQYEFYNWQQTVFPSLDACRAHAIQAHDKLKPVWRRGDGPAIFSFIASSRVTTLCIRDGDRITVITATNGFSQEETLRLRDTIAKDFEPMRRP